MPEGQDTATAERTLAVLGPRARTEVVCRWRFADSGYQPVIVRVDPGDAVAESDEAVSLIGAASRP